MSGLLRILPFASSGCSMLMGGVATCSNIRSRNNHEKAINFLKNHQINHAVDQRIFPIVNSDKGLLALQISNYKENCIRKEKINLNIETFQSVSASLQLVSGIVELCETLSKGLYLTILNNISLFFWGFSALFAFFGLIHSAKNRVDTQEKIEKNNSQIKALEALKAQVLKENERDPNGPSLEHLSQETLEIDPKSLSSKEVINFFLKRETTRLELENIHLNLEKDYLNQTLISNSLLLISALLGLAASIFTGGLPVYILLTLSIVVTGINILYQQFFAIKDADLFYGKQFIEQELKHLFFQKNPKNLSILWDQFKKVLYVEKDEPNLQLGFWDKFKKALYLEKEEPQVETKPKLSATGKHFFNYINADNCIRSLTKSGFCEEDLPSIFSVRFEIALQQLLIDESVYLQLN